MVKELETLADYEEVIKSVNLVVIIFTAIWCPPSQAIKPKFDSLAKNPSHRTVTFCSCDVDANDQAYNKAEVGCMPTLQFYKNGSKIDTMEAADYDVLVAKVNKHKIQKTQIIRDKSALQPNQAKIVNKYPPEMFEVHLDTKKWIHLFFNLQMQGWWPFIDFDIKILSNTPGMFVEEKIADRHGCIKDLVISKDPNLEKDHLI